MVTQARARAAARKIAELVEAPRARLAERRWPLHSRLLLVPESAPWVIAREMDELSVIARRLGIELAPGRWHRQVRQQSVFYGSQFALQREIPAQPGNNVGVSYFHGRPGTPGAPEFDEGYDTLRRLHSRIQRLHVSNTEMRDVLLKTGIEADKVFLIPIGVDADRFRPASVPRDVLRELYEIPTSAVVVGSFQKDGVGWGDGDTPKAIKGPDVLLEALDRVRPYVPELFVLLTGPARGFVKSGLAARGIPYRHIYVSDYAELPPLYAALDAYVISSRQEGGPKALLESMAVGSPVVTTRVGQAADLAIDGVNALVVPPDDPLALADGMRRLLEDHELARTLVTNARATAEANSYRALEPRWKQLFDGFVSGCE
jgi:glycosyltransferase involved in cell wall biosynthesis